MSRRVWVIRCRWPCGLRRVAGQRHVDPVGQQALFELAGLERLRAQVEHLLERHARLVRGLARRPALLGRQRRDRAQDGRSAPTCGRGSARAAPRAPAVVARLRDRGLGLAAQLVEAGGQAWAAHPIPLVEGHGGRHRGVEGVGAVGAERDRCARRRRAASITLGRAARAARRRCTASRARRPALRQRQPRPVVERDRGAR